MNGKKLLLKYQYANEYSEKADLNGFKCVFPNIRIYSHGFNIYCSSINFLILLLCDRRRAKN